MAAFSRDYTVREVRRPKASRTRSRVSLEHFAMWTLRLTTRSFGRPRKLSRSGNPRRGIYSTLGRAGSGDAAFLVMRDPKDEERILFLTAKNNLGKDPGGLAHRIGVRFVGEQDAIEALAAANRDARDRTATRLF
jgi:hypothetical protein